MRICACDAHGSTDTAQRAWATAACSAESGGGNTWGWNCSLTLPADLSGSLEACTLGLVLQASTASTRAALAGVSLASRGGSPLHLLQYESGRWLSLAGGDEGAWEKHPPGCPGRPWLAVYSEATVSSFTFDGLITEGKCFLPRWSQ